MVGLLWMNDQLVTVGTTYTMHDEYKKTNMHALIGIQTHDPTSQVAVDLHLRQHDYWDQQWM